METEAFIQEPPAPAKVATGPKPVCWYRSPIEPKIMKELCERSDFRGGLQTFGYLGVLLVTGGVAWYSAYHFPWWATLLALFLYGTCFAFQMNAIHELCHNTVFKTKALNAIFLRLFSFMGWQNFEMFQASHARHHRYTLHCPDDQEVVLPLKLMVVHFLKCAIVCPSRVYNMPREMIRQAAGRLKGEWELTLFPEGSPDRHVPINWARTVVAGHAGVFIVAACTHLWMLPVLITLPTFYGEWLFFLCNNTQHIGLQDDVPDFRLCCRTFTLNPVVQFLYWHMNFHIEHHMYAAVPCYNLPRLHRLIQHDLPPSPHGIIATWREIAAIQKIQESNPDYQYAAPLPTANPTIG